MRSKSWKTLLLLATFLISFTPTEGAFLAGSPISPRAQVSPAENPPWPEDCELKVTLILDHSNSIMEGDPFSPNPGIMKAAAKNLVSTLAGKFAQVSVVSFWDTAETMIQLTPLDTPENIEAVGDAIDRIQFFTSDSRGSTNWEAAFKEASLSASVTEDPRKPADVIVILTDGRPTTYGYPGDDKGDGSSVDPIDIEHGVEGANVLKNEGTKVIAVGIGDLTVENLELISGPEQSEDYYLLSEFEQLDATLQQIALRVCAIKVEKTANPELIESGGQTTYGYSVTNPGDLPVSNVVLEDDTCGPVQFTAGDVNSNAELDLEETWEFQCVSTLTTDTSNIGFVTGEIDGFHVADKDDAYVEVTPRIEVSKSSHPSNLFEPGGEVQFTISVANASDEEATLFSLIDTPYGDLTTLPGSTCTVPVPLSDEAYVCTFSAQIDGSAGDQKTDTITAIASDDEGHLATDTASATVEILSRPPLISVQKTNDANQDGIFSDDEVAAWPGIQVSFQAQIHNLTSAPLTLISFTDDLHPASVADCTSTQIPADGSVVCNYLGTITSAFDSIEIDTVTALAEDSLGFQSEASDSSTVRTPSPPPPPGVGTQGFWKNHPEAWPVDEIAVGGISYSREQAIQIMSTPEKGDKTYSMFRQLVAAMLNVMAGNDPSCITETIDAANQWLETYGPPGSRLKAKTAAWKQGEPLKDRLDAYNNGRLCAPSR